jgi:hypothetical protein
MLTEDRRLSLQMDFEIAKTYASYWQTVVLSGAYKHRKLQKGDSKAEGGWRTFTEEELLKDALDTMLAHLPPAELESIVKAAKELRAKKLLVEIPPEKIEELKALHEEITRGEDVTIHFNLPLKLSVNIGTEGSNWEYGHVRNWKLELGETASDRAKKFFERYMNGAEDVIREDSSSLETLSPVCASSIDRQTDLFKRFDTLKTKLEDTYEVDLWPILEKP